MNLTLLLCLFVLNFANCANILGVYFHGVKSHHILGEKLFKELARRGHNVTMASPFPLAEPFPNYTDVHLTGILEHQLARESMLMEENEGNMFTGIENYLELTRGQSEITLNHTQMRRLLLSGTKFDVIIMDWFINISVLMFGKLFDAPIIALSASGTTYVANLLVANPAPPSYVPLAMLDFPPNMTFLQRVGNVLVKIAFDLVAINELKYHQDLLEKYYEDPPTLEELMDNVAVVLSNAHYSFESPRPFLPNVIPVGGFHVERPQKLPEDLQSFMDAAKEGVIYFSLGSNMKSVLLPPEKRRQILKTFSKIPYRVLWKFEEDHAENKPCNVLVRKWFPQKDILAHPNLKLFITHGGLLSTIEALHHAVPIIGIPIIGDQRGNIANAQTAGYGLLLELSDLDETTFSQAIHRVISNSKYRENVNKLSQLLHDQPISPMDTAIFWVEHVIRHKGAPHLRNAGRHLPWHKYLMIDVALFIIISLALLLWPIYFIVRKLIGLCSHHGHIKEKVQ